MSGITILKKWFKRSHRRYIAEALQKFICYNQELFDFLDVTPIIQGSGKDTTISFKSSHFVGAIPLRAPDTGKQVGDFVVTPRYTALHDKFSDYFEIINLTQAEYPPEFTPSIPLLTDNNIKPPLYLESVKYFDLLEKGLTSNWNKFQNIKRTYDFPKPSVDWSQYLSRSYDPEKKFRYPSTSNSLSKYHEEFFQLKYVYNIAKKEINSDKTPRKIRYYTYDKMKRLDKHLLEFSSKPIKTLFIHNSDPLIIKKIKEQGNIILKNDSSNIPAWRIDFSRLFEKYIQFIFRKIALEIGAKQYDNYKIRRMSRYSPQWSLNYLEPDIFLVKDQYNILADAKYKSHILNIGNAAESLKEQHRDDLHQILAYSSFSGNVNKLCFLCYPNTSVYYKELDYFSKISKINNKIVLLGVPLSKSEIPKIIFNVKLLINEFQSLLTLAN